MATKRHKKTQREKAMALTAARGRANPSAFLFSCLFVAFCGDSALGQAVDPPVAGRPAQFSGVVGRYRLEVSAAPTSVVVEEAVTLRVRVVGQGPARYQPR